MIVNSPEWKALEQLAEQSRQWHLREQLQNKNRCNAMQVEHDDIVLDYSRQNMNPETLQALLKLADAAELGKKIEAKRTGEAINNTENRAVLHMALRANPEDEYRVDNESVTPLVIDVRHRIATIAEAVRQGKHLGVTGKPLRNVIAIGIGGSYLGAEFVFEAIRQHTSCANASADRQLRFLANVDPADFHRATEGLNPAETLVVIISKTFTTTETMLNARAAKAWLSEALGAQAVSKQIFAVSTNISACEQFGIQREHIFGFWDWVGGRYSVCSAVGLLPLALHFGWQNIEQFLRGARAMDQHFLSAPFAQNLPVLLGLIGVWNSSFLKRPVRALLPYSQALHRFAAHIQQVDMESNGKLVDREGRELPLEAGEINFGEPGTNGQHSFYQLIHQGRVIPADFIGFCRPQTSVKLTDNRLDLHDELMANFFAQPDALALGKTEQELRAEGVPEALIPHKVFPGNRPSNVLLFPELNPYRCGQLLALYEHRTAVQGFIWNLNSFDQWGVELGKVLAQRVKLILQTDNLQGSETLPFSTQQLLNKYRQR